VEILLIDDNPGDALLTKECLYRCSPSTHLRVATDGAIALAVLCQEDNDRPSHLPDLILLDLNLPCQNGMEVLARIKSNSKLLDIPIVILTASNREDDIKKAYALHANCLVTKPVAFEEFAWVIRSIISFWGTIAKLPTTAASLAF
jgi:CheY-like chemotaxis protein